MNKWILVVLAAIPLLGCQLGVDQEDDGEIDTVTVSSTDDNSVIIDEEETYHLSVTGSGNSITLRGDVSQITVKADKTTLIIEDDVLIDKMTLSSDNNDVSIPAGLQTVISNLSIAGEDNLVTVYDVTTSAIVEDKGNVVTLTKPAP